MTTLRELIPIVERALSQSAGTAVQKYAQDRIADMIQDTFDLLFKKKFWPQFMLWEQLQLDGVTGVPITVPKVKDFTDIRIAFPSNVVSRKLRQTPSDVNPMLFFGDDAIYIEGSSTRVFRCYPVNSTNTILMHSRIKPDDFGLESVIDMDRLMMKYYAAWMYAADDGHNPGQIQKLQMLAETRYDQISAALLELPLELDPRYPDTVTQWNEAAP